jgi:uncharacterized OB-fold protein
MKTRVPALGADGWFTEEGPALVGSRCLSCHTLAFPAAATFCGNPACSGRAFEPAPLGPGGTVWSYTDLRYQPPPPFVPVTYPFEPVTLLAVEVDHSGLVVLGQAVAGTSVDDIHIGTRVTLVIDPLFSDDTHDHTIWKWRPEAAAQ